MKWLKNLETIAESKKSGVCPYCGSENTDYSFCGTPLNIGFGVVWCNDCKKAYHISRIQIVDGYNLNKEIPKDLSYN